MQIATKEMLETNGILRGNTWILFFFWWKEIPITTLQNILLFLLFATNMYGQMEIGKQNLRGTTEVIGMNEFKQEREGRQE